MPHVGHAPLGGDVVIDGARYVLARDIQNRPGIAWWTVGSDDEEELGKQRIVTSRWERGWYGGMSEAVRISPDSAGYAFTESMDAHTFGFVRLSERRFSATPTNTVTDSPAFFFEQGGAIFLVNGRFGYRMTVSGTTITITHEVDFGASAAAGRPDKFEGLWYIPLGASVDFAEVTTPATFSTTAAGGSMRALAFSVYQDGSTSKLARGYSTNLVALAATAPLTAGNWGSGFEVGDTSDAITSIVDTGVSLFVAKVDNMYVFDGTGNNYPVFHFARGTGDATNGVGLAAIPSTSTALYNHQSGLHLAASDTVALNIGPDGNIARQAIPGLSLEPFRGRHYETVVYGSWVYSLYRVTDGGSTRTYTLAGRRVQGLQSIVWHTYALFEGAARGLFVDSSQRLWNIEGTTIGFRQLGQDGSPDAGGSSNGRGTVSTTHRLVLPSTDFGFPTTTKQLQRARVTVRGVSTASPAQFRVIRDGGTIENVSAQMTTAGTHSRWWTAGLNDTCIYATPVLEVVTTSGYAPASSDPQVWAVEVDALLLPTGAAIIKGIIDCEAPFSDGQQQIDPPRVIRDRLAELRRTASVTIIDIDGGHVEANVVDVSDIQVAEGPDGVSRYIVEVTMRQRPLESIAEVLESGAQVGMVVEPSNWEVAVSNVLVGTVFEVDVVEVAEAGVLVGSVSL